MQIPPNQSPLSEDLDCNSRRALATLSLSMRPLVPHTGITSLSITLEKYGQCLHPLNLMAALAILPSLQHLTVETRTSCSSFPPNFSHWDADLPHLRSLTFYATGNMIACILDHLTIPTTTILDFRVQNYPGYINTVRTLFVAIGRVKRGSEDISQTFAAMKILPANRSIVLEGYTSLPSSSTMDDKSLQPSVRIALFAYRGQVERQSVGSVVFECISSALQISGVEHLFLSDVVADSATPLALATFLESMPMVRQLHWEETQWEQEQDEGLSSLMTTAVYLGAQQSKRREVIHHLHHLLRKTVYVKGLRRVLKQFEEYGVLVGGFKLKLSMAMTGDN